MLMAGVTIFTASQNVDSNLKGNSTPVAPSTLDITLKVSAGGGNDSGAKQHII